MERTNEHPSVKRYHKGKAAQAPRPETLKLSSRELRGMCLDYGADDVGFVEIDRPSLADQKADILGMFPWTKTLVSFVGTDQPGKSEKPRAFDREPRIASGWKSGLTHAAHALGSGPRA